MAGGGSMVIKFFAKANFSLLQRNMFYLTTKFVENIENGTPISIPIKKLTAQQINYIE